MVKNNQSTGAAAEKRFALVFCLCFVCLGSLVFVFKRTDLFPWPGSCHAGGYDSEYYMAYCHNTRYGDYEHFALYKSSEPEALVSLKKAQVLFLGNSRTQYAFSTKAILDYFDSRNVDHYVMGFGQGAMSPVANAVMQAHALQPALLVANADPFFSDEVNGTFQRILDGDTELDNEFGRKKRLQTWQASVCSNSNHWLHNLVCNGEDETLYRSRKNGHWLTQFYRDNQHIPVSESNALLDQLDNTQHKVAQFIEQTNIRPECLVLTVTPRTETPAQFAKALAAATGLPLIMPQLSDLHTIDHSHLDSESAERWSASFLQQLDEHMEQCVKSPAIARTDADN